MIKSDFFNTLVLSFSSFPLFFSIEVSILYFGSIPPLQSHKTRMKNLYFGQLFSTFILEIFSDFLTALVLLFSTFVQFCDSFKERYYLLWSYYFLISSNFHKISVKISNLMILLNFCSFMWFSLILIYFGIIILYFCLFLSADSH